MMKPSDSDVDSAVGSRAEADVDSEVPPESSRASDPGQETSRAPRPGPGADDLREYAHILGANLQETDMSWVVREAFDAPLPSVWSEHMDEEGRVYFFNQITQESTWAHPMDGVYRELIILVQSFRAERPAALPEPRLKVVKEHLEQAHRRSIEQLEGWSGPYPCDAGEYWYSEPLGVSTWVNPVEDFEYELAVRQTVLHRCLLPDFAEQGATYAVAGTGEPQSGEPLRLTLPGSRMSDEEAHEAMLSSRSFYSARESSRSGNSERSLREFRDALHSPSRTLKVIERERALASSPVALESCREEAAEAEATVDSPDSLKFAGAPLLTSQS